MVKKLFLLAALLISLTTVANAQITGTCTDPNIVAKIVRCVRTGDKCILDGVIENVGYKDVPWYIGGGIYHHTSLYDDMGNQYSVQRAFFGGNEVYGGAFPSQIPIKVRLEVHGVSDIATMIRRFDWTIQLNNDQNWSTIRIENIPITTGKRETPKSSQSSQSPSGETTLTEDVGELVNSVNELVNLFKKKKK